MISAIALVALLTAQAPERPRAADPLLVRAQALFEALKFEEARAAYEQATSVRLADLAEVTAAWEGLGLVCATLGDDECAKAAFLTLLAVNPEAQLLGGDISPRQRAPFDAARAQAAGRGAIRVDHLPPAAWPAGMPITLEVKIASDWHELVGGARIQLERGGVREEISVAGKPPFLLVVPPAAPSKLSYWIEAIDARGSPVATWRSLKDPMKVEVLADVVAPTPIYKRAWFWVAAGVVVAGTATAIVFAATQEPVYQLKTQSAP